MHDQPETTEREEELAGTERHQDEDAMRWPAHDDPERPHEQEGEEES